MKKYKCPCCGNFTLDEQPPGTHDICDVCFWEDDGVQFDEPNRSGGANTMSLNEAKQNYIKYGAKSEDRKQYVRSPLEEEKPENNE